MKGFQKNMIDDNDNDNNYYYYFRKSERNFMESLL